MAVIVAVSFVNMVEMAVDEVVDVVSVRYRIVPAVCAMHVTRGVPIAVVARSAPVWMGCVHGDDALVDVIVVHHVEMAIVQIVDVTVMLDRAMAAVGTMNMLVARMHVVFAHPGRPPIFDEG